jgi:hypothetical protein
MDTKAHEEEQVFAAAAQAITKLEQWLADNLQAQRYLAVRKLVYQLQQLKEMPRE